MRPSNSRYRCFWLEALLNDLSLFGDRVSTTLGLRGRFHCCWLDRDSGWCAHPLWSPHQGWTAMPCWIQTAKTRRLRIERGRFVWPKAENGAVALTRAQLSMLLEGIDWRRPLRTATPQMAVW